MEKNATNIIELVDVCKEFDGVSAVSYTHLMTVNMTITSAANAAITILAKRLKP